MKNTLFILSMFLALTGYPQDKADSLKKVIAVKPTEYDLLWLSYYYVTKNLDSCRKYSRLLYNLALKDKSTSFQGWGLSFQALLFTETGDETDALQYISRAEQLFGQLGDSDGLAFVYLTDTFIFNDAEYADLKLGYLQKALKFSSSNPKPKITPFPRRFFESLALLGLGEYYMEHSKPDSGLFYTEKFNSVIQDIPDKRYLGDGMLNLGNYYKGKNLDSIALNYYRQAVSSFLAYGNSNGLSNDYLSMAAIFEREKNPDSVYTYALRSYLLSQGGKEFNIMVNSSKLLIGYFKMRHQLDSAFNYQQMMIISQDSLSNETKLRNFQTMVFDRQLELQKSHALRQQLIDRGRFYALLGGLAMLLLLAVILWGNNRQKQQKNILLHAQKVQLEKTLEELRATQQQLVQAEKMASLGELTAGIAHEIQNPLNFVNNFSDLSVELAGELKEEVNKLDNPGNGKNLINGLADDLVTNQQKINFHGKRADAIVKSMLQHSRNSTGQKEPVDLNSMAEEYLRLSYHGLRAKDKSFNSKMETRFDPGIGNVQLIPQDFGRVLLNLFNNAFYSVAEKMKQQVTGYEPLVSVVTRKLDHQIEILVRDNGMGIPEHVVNKIFQPFFTTKPAGEGTGLGLSLSYDIVTREHGGVLEMETSPGEYAEFRIRLPVTVG